jgi:uncharacterized protein (TIGR03083 family)
VQVGDHYRSQREDLSTLALTLTDEQLARQVPGCPDWTVRDLFGHLVGVPADALAAELDGAGQPPWTQQQIEARRALSVAELVAEWERTGPALEQTLDELGFLGWILTYDVTMHGDDLREALGLPLGDSPTHAAVLDGIIDRARRRAVGLGSLVLRSGGREWVLGEGEPRATLTVDDPGELARVIGARRADDEIRGLDWTGDPEPWIGVLPLFRAER